MSAVSRLASKMTILHNVDMSNSKPGRSLCLQCHRPVSNCICRWVVSIANFPEILLLQHPLEVNNAKGSARLLHLCLQHSKLLIGEQFDEVLLHESLYADKRQPVLLYPSTSGSSAPDLQSEGDAFDMTGYVLQGRETSNLRLVMIDATWRKSRKMLYLNPVLQQLPRLSLQNMPASHYRIRKAHAPDQLSTLEACAYALMQLEQDEEKYQSLIRAFDGFVGQQIAFRPIS